MKQSLLFVTLLAGALVGFASESLARDTLVFVDGSRMEVESYTVKDKVVQFVTTDGKLRSVPRSYVNLPATQGSAAARPQATAQPSAPTRPAPAARPAPPPARPAPAPPAAPAPMPEPEMEPEMEEPESEMDSMESMEMEEMEPEAEPEPAPMPAPAPVAPVMPAPAPPPSSAPAPMPAPAQTPTPAPAPAPMTPAPMSPSPSTPTSPAPAPAAPRAMSADVNPPSWSDNELKVSLIAPSAQWQIKEMPASFDVAVTLTNPSTEARATLALIRQKMRSRKDFEAVLADVESSISSAPGYRSLSNGIVDLPPYTAHEFRFMKDVGFVGTFNQLVVVYSRDLAYVLSMTCPEQRMRESTGDFQAIVRGLNIEKSSNELKP